MPPFSRSLSAAADLHSRNGGDRAHWKIGQSAAISILLIGISMILEPLIQLAIIAIAFIPLISSFYVISDITVANFYAGYVSIALMLISAIILYMGLRTRNDQWMATIFSMASLLAFSVLSFPGNYSYTYSTTNGSSSLGGIGPVHYLLIHFFGFTIVSEVANGTLYALGLFALIMSVYLLGRLDRFKILGKVFIAIAMVPGAGDIAESYITYNFVTNFGFGGTSVGPYLFLLPVFIAAFFGIVLPITCFLIYRMYRQSRGNIDRYPVQDQEQE